MPNQSQIHRDITDRIIAGLRNGVIPWRRPWGSKSHSGLPANCISRRSYSGINALLLDLVSMSRGYTSRWWGTYRQWASLECHVQKRPYDVEPGQWGTQVVLYKQIERTIDDDGETKKQRFPLIRYFAVFHCEQVDGLVAEKLRTSPQAKSSPLAGDYQEAQRVIDATQAVIKYGGDKAQYIRPWGLCPWPHHMGGDEIQMPQPGSFVSPSQFYECALHELVHWTECRLKWEGSYSIGELVAEIGACFMAAEIGIPNSDDLSNHIAYLAHWLRELENDPRAILRAASQASKASRFILNFSRTSEDKPVEEAEHATS